MRGIGVVRKTDQLGRIVLPKELRDKHNMPEGTPMEIYVDGESIILKKYERGCVFCGSMDGLTEFSDKDICQGCRSDLRG